MIPVTSEWQNCSHDREDRDLPFKEKKNLKIFIKLEERRTTVSNTRMAAVSDKGAKACE